MRSAPVRCSTATFWLTKAIAFAGVAQGWWEAASASPLSVYGALSDSFRQQSRILSGPIRSRLPAMFRVFHSVELGQRCGFRSRAGHFGADGVGMPRKQNAACPRFAGYDAERLRVYFVLSRKATRMGSGVYTPPMRPLSTSYSVVLRSVSFATVLYPE